MITSDYALLQAANLRVSYADRDMQRLIEHIVYLTDLSDAKDLIIALVMSAHISLEDMRMLLEDNSDIMAE